MSSFLKNTFSHLASRSVKQSPGLASLRWITIHPGFFRSCVKVARVPLDYLLDLDPFLQRKLGKRPCVELELWAEVRKCSCLSDHLCHQVGTIVSARLNRVSSQQNSCNGYSSTHKPLPPMTSYLGTFEGERKRNTRGFDEDCSLTRALLSLLAITVFLYAVSLFTRVY